MTAEEAICTLSDYKTSCSGCEFHHELGCELEKHCDEAVYMAISALEKQIPQKPNHYDDTEQFYVECPACGRRYDSRSGYKGCPYCLQRIDWSEEE